MSVTEGGTSEAVPGAAGAPAATREVSEASLRQPVMVIGVLLAGAAVAVSLGVYGQVHDPTGESPYRLFFTNTINLKVWFATIAVALALFQAVSALRIFGRLKFPREMPSWYGDAHRLSGTLAFLFSLPVAYHCLWSLGLQSSDTRVLVHSLLGCAFYGIFATKVIGVRSHSLPGWFLPIIGGATFTLVVGLWVTSSLWFFTNVGFPQF